MDRAAYVAMTGAKHIMLAQGVGGHNIANINTPGFRADLYAFASSPIYGPGYASRVNSVAEDGGWSADGGAVENTGRELDVAVQGTGFIAIQAPDGSEAYTRAGDLRVGADGLLTTGAGHPVLGISAGRHSALRAGDDRYRRHRVHRAARPGREHAGERRPHQAGQPARQSARQGRRRTAAHARQEAAGAGGRRAADGRLAGIEQRGRGTVDDRR